MTVFSHTGHFCVPEISALWPKEQKTCTRYMWTKAWHMPRISFSNGYFSRICWMQREMWTTYCQTVSKRRLHIKKIEWEQSGWIFTPLRNSSRRVCPSLQLFEERSCFASMPSPACSTYSRSGREGEVSDMTSSEVSMSGTAGDRGWNQCWRGRNTCLSISHEMQPGTNWTGPAGSLNRPKPA